MKIKVINQHSFVDLITNSSSELFVCDTDKSIKMVEEILNDIIISYANNNLKEFISLCSWLDSSFVFKYFKVKSNYGKYDYEPRREEISALLNKAKKDNSLNDFILKFASKHIFRVSHAKFCSSLLGLTLNKGDYISEKIYRNYNYAQKYIKYILSDSIFMGNYRIKKNGKYIYKNNKRYNKLHTKLYYSLSSSSHWFDIHDKKVNFVIRNNKIDSNDEDTYSEISNLVGFGVNFSQNDILIWSIHDNSIPYELWDEINNTFNGNNYHLG